MSNNAPTNNTQINRPSKATGRYHSMKGTVVEAIGDMTGWKSWQQSGREEHARGEAEIDRAKVQNYLEATGDRIGGRLDAVVGAVAGDRQREISGNARQDSGKLRQGKNQL